jgi:hypothetical protein
LAGINRLHASVRRVYQLLGAEERLGLSIAPGPHKDLQELQVAVFRFFDQHLKGDSRLIQRAAEKQFTPAELKVFPTNELPSHAVNPRIDEHFVAAAEPKGALSLPVIQQKLREQSFRGWPEETIPRTMGLVAECSHEGIHFRRYELLSQEHVPLALVTATLPETTSPRSTQLEILDESGWNSWAGAMAAVLGTHFTDLKFDGSTTPSDESTRQALQTLLESIRRGERSTAWLAPRGVGPTAWTTHPGKRVQIRRRFMLLGQTLDSMRVWDIRTAIQRLGTLESTRAPLELSARGPMSINALYASLFEDNVQTLQLVNPPASHRDGPDYLNVLKVLDIPQALDLARTRLKIKE